MTPVLERRDLQRRYPATPRDAPIGDYGHLIKMMIGREFPQDLARAALEESHGAPYVCIPWGVFAGCMTVGLSKTSKAYKFIFATLTICISRQQCLRIMETCRTRWEIPRERGPVPNPLW